MGKRGEPVVEVDDDRSMGASAAAALRTSVFDDRARKLPEMARIRNGFTDL